MNTHQNSITVGIDVSKKSLDFYILPTQKCFSVENSTSGFLVAKKQLNKFHIERLVVEATGRMETAFVRWCLKHQLPIIVINPVRIRKFADALGLTAKTDALDAKVIARFGEAIKPAPKTEHYLQESKIKDLLVRRHQLVEMMTMEKNRLGIMPT